MRITVVAVGRVKQPALRDACNEYEGRIRRYLRFDVREVRAVARGSSNPIATMSAEARALLGAVSGNTRVFAVARDGMRDSSEAFAARVARWLEDARDVALLIGGAHGLDERVLGRAEEVLSLSALTFSHELARLVLFEQVYRACTILRGEPYHKGPQ